MENFCYDNNGNEKYINDVEKCNEFGKLNEKYFNGQLISGQLITHHFGTIYVDLKILTSKTKLYHYGTMTGHKYHIIDIFDSKSAKSFEMRSIDNDAFTIGYEKEISFVCETNDLEIHFDNWVIVKTETI